MSLASRFARSTASSMPSMWATEPDPALARRVRLTQGPLREPERAVGDVEAGFGGSKPDSDRGGGEIDQVLAEIHLLSVWVQLPATADAT